MFLQLVAGRAVALARQIYDSSRKVGMELVYAPNLGIFVLSVLHLVSTASARLSI